MTTEPYRELRPGAGGWAGLELGGLDDLGDDAPEVLWARGDENLWLRDPSAIVGSRASTAYGELMASQLAADLAAAGHSIIVEVGYGIAMAAMRGALAQEGHVLALSGAGIDSDYPRAAEALGPRQATALLRAARDVMAEALEQGGTSFDPLYVNVNGESGYFSRSLNAYGQEGRPCPRCATPIRRERFMNRSSFTCPRCQPTPRQRRT